MLTSIIFIYLFKLTESAQSRPWLSPLIEKSMMEPINSVNQEIAASGMCRRLDIDRTDDQTHNHVNGYNTRPKIMGVADIKHCVSWIPDRNIVYIYWVKFIIQPMSFAVASIYEDILSTSIIKG